MSLQILLHSSKTMRTASGHYEPLGSPILLPKAKNLVDIWSQASPDDIQQRMKISAKKSEEVKAMYDNWSTVESYQTPAIDAFVGDIYSGLQAHSWTSNDREYAHKYLLVLSGLYGGLRACDGIMPYRLEMGYKLPSGLSMYKYWGDTIATLLPENTEHIINLSAVEYTKSLLPYTHLPVITPKFLTVSPKTGEPTFVTVHTKVARGAFANWLIKNRIDDTSKLHEFTDIGYKYDSNLSTTEQPVFVCEKFGGLGLSVRLQ